MSTLRRRRNERVLTHHSDVNARSFAERHDVVPTRVEPLESAAKKQRSA
jgi:hypothetical protein